MFYKHLGIENADSFITSYREFDSMRPARPGTRNLGILRLFFPLKKKYRLIDLTVPGISCGIRDFQSSLWHAVSLNAACKLLVTTRGI